MVLVDGMEMPESLPARGAWIEICHILLLVIFIFRRSPHGERGLKSSVSHNAFFERASLPARGAWIEMVERLLNAFISLGRSPHGERGLKFRGIRPSQI